ncbi:hypothetical protein [Wolbachia endosymbiont of Psylliodes chrysocephala]|uniref:hypothetical protein n=1 Tax=Wolbachia endosymbiont of Psylliodes chrysocephala TaxID=2883236 RepID=UPI00209E189A|nr:hypothetical protein [Wolbachia endosymbiont of Psylliodes chrysocephala]
MSGQHLYDVIQVAFFSCHPSALFLSSQCSFFVIPVLFFCHPSALFLSSQCSFFVIRVAPFLSSQCPDTGIQEKEWCHASSPYNVIPVRDTGI